jgi:hypothetical protein
MTHIASGLSAGLAATLLGSPVDVVTTNNTTNFICSTYAIIDC